MGGSGVDPVDRTGRVGPSEYTTRLKSRLSYRTIPLREDAEGLLRRRLQRKEDLIRRGVRSEALEEFVFSTPRLHRMPDVDEMKKHVRKAFDAAGEPEMTIHTLRRAVERRLEEAGLPRMDRESIMGHTITVAERHYSTHGVPERALDALGQSGQ